MTIDRDTSTAEFGAPPSPQPGRYGTSVPRIVLGLLLVAIGLRVTLDTMRVVRIDYAGGLWPVALIGVGAAKLWQGWSTAEAGAGVWLLLAGAWFLAVHFHVVGLTFQNSWPLLLVATGIAMAWKALLDPVSSRTSRGSTRRPSPNRTWRPHTDRGRGHAPSPVGMQGRNPVTGGFGHGDAHDRPEPTGHGDDCVGAGVRAGGSARAGLRSGGGASIVERGTHQDRSRSAREVL